MVQERADRHHRSSQEHDDQLWNGRPLQLIRHGREENEGGGGDKQGRLTSRPSTLLVSI